MFLSAAWPSRPGDLIWATSTLMVSVFGTFKLADEDPNAVRQCSIM